MLEQDSRLWTIADRVGTPFYVFDAAAIRRQCAELKARFPNVEFFYSLKANPNLSVVRQMVLSGMGCEACSLLELETSIAAGVRADRTLFVGPAKSVTELSRCVALGIKAVVVESIVELERLDSLAGTMGKTQSVALRINPDFRFAGAKLNMSGRATQFGIDQSTVDAMLPRIENCRNVRIVGLHVYMGTRILDHATIVSNTRHTLELAGEIQKKLGHPLRFVDVGGGFGVPYHEGEAELDLAALQRDLSPVISDYEAVNPQGKVCIELGRYLIAAAGRFVTAVRQTKTTKGENFATCDGGSNVHSAAAGQGSLLRKNFPISLIKRGAAPQPGHSVAPWTITGPLCTPMDVIGKDVQMDEPTIGDLICIPQSGAYGATASPVNFLGFGQPAEVMVDGDAITLVRERASIDAILEDQRPRTLPVVGGASSRSLGRTPASVFDHPCLNQLDGLKDLLVASGGKLEQDADCWRDLWADPILRAFTLIGVPDDYNGYPISDSGLAIEACSYGLHIAMIERLARFDASCILALQGPSLSGGAVMKMGTKAQIERFFAAYRTGPQGTFFAVTEPEAGSDPSVGSSVLSGPAGARRLNGRKMLVGNVKRAAIGLLFARSEETGRPVLVLIEPDKYASYIKIERLPTLGLRGADLCRITINDLPVDDAMILGDGLASLRDGFLAINDVFERNRPIVAALALGTGRGILDHVGATAPAAARSLRDLELRHAALLRRLAAVLDAYESGHPKTQDISLIKLQAVAFVDEVVRRALSLSSSADLMMDPGFRKRTRDAKAFEYMEGATNIHAMNAFRSYVAGMPR
ncbi:acyl-CoA dehydrogenase family protein [Agrobacterium rosae]|uniref:Acyl-CoA dehydrogenase family protein n=1 Tax=Agrobacterium rosae TaxID=1972867 RepID=A0AAW9FQV7_9HYPH|nr:acyl-CoA dehydrogenase family protein [Agrobacterium rosae]MDX8305546.1 acyl-CoA dehydrogenase family protein [Agrobacterium rosae]